MSQAQKVPSFKQRVLKLKHRLKREKKSLKKLAEDLGYTGTDVYNLTGRKDHPDSGKLYDLGVKLGLIEGEQA